MKYLTNFLIAIVSLIVLLFVFEVVLHILGWQPHLAFYPKGMFKADSTKGYQLAPMFKGRMRREEYDVLIEINSIGLRERVLSEFKEDATKILIVGDSFVIGYFVEQRETLPAQLEHKLLQYHKQNVQCINVGVSGYGL